MPRYFFTARSLKGEPYSGIREAKDKHELARILRQEGYILISAVLTEEAEKKRRFEISLPIFAKVSPTEKMIFTRNLQVMIAAGVSLPRALKILFRQAKTKVFADTLLKIEEELRKGKSFSASLSKYPDIFPEIFYSMIKVGEETGTLEEVLKNLTLQMEREHELRSKIKGAMIYPAVIICAMIGIGFLMLTIVIPRLAETFEELGIDLPPTTQFVINLGIFTSEKWYLVIFIVITLFFILRTALKTKTGKKIKDALTIKMPIIASLVKKTNAAYTVRTLSALIASGVPIVRSLEIISGAIGNVYFKDAIAQAAEGVKKGAKLADCLRPFTHLYPLMVVQMIEVGEETGQTSSILAKLADFFEEEVSAATKNLASVIEPAIMMLIGGAVGFFAISMIQPMYAMLGAL